MKFQLCALCEKIKDARRYCDRCYHVSYFYPHMMGYSSIVRRTCFVCGFVMGQYSSKSSVSVCRPCYMVVNARWQSWRKERGLTREQAKGAFKPMLRWAMWNHAPLVWDVDARQLLVSTQGMRYGKPLVRKFPYHQSRWKPKTPKRTTRCPWCGESKGPAQDVCHECLPLWRKIVGLLCGCGNFKSQHRLECLECEGAEFPGIPAKWPFPDCLPFPFVKEDKAHLWERLNEKRTPPEPLPDDTKRHLKKLRAKARRK